LLDLADRRSAPDDGSLVRRLEGAPERIRHHMAKVQKTENTQRESLDTDDWRTVACWRRWMSTGPST
jgi:hypothetical protein